MELDAFERGFGGVGPDSAEAHDDAAGRGEDCGPTACVGVGSFGDWFVGPCRHFPAVFVGFAWRDGVFDDDQRVVAGGVEGTGEAAEDALVVVADGTDFAVHGNDVARDGHAVHVGHGLVAQADAQDWNFACEARDHVGGNAGFFGRARAWRDDEARGAFAVTQGSGFVGGDFVVANDEQVAADLEGAVDFSKALDEVPGEGVVVVDEEDHSIRIGDGRRVVKTRSGRQAERHGG